MLTQYIIDATRYVGRKISGSTTFMEGVTPDHPTITGIALLAIYLVIATALSIVILCTYWTIQDKLGKNQPTTTQLTCEVENDVGNLYDLKIPAESIISVFLTAFVASMWVGVIDHPTVTLLAHNTLLVVTCILSPVTLLAALHAANVFHYIRGTSENKNNATTAALDLAGLLSFITRFGIQILRYGIIIAKLKLLTMALSPIAETPNTANVVASQVKNVFDSPTTFWWKELKTGITHILHVVIESAETFLLYYTQLGALAVVVMWLLSALNSFNKRYQYLHWFKNKK